MTRFPSAAFPNSLLVSLVLSLPLSGLTLSLAIAESDRSSRPTVEVNLNALKPAKLMINAPTRIIDGETVIVLTPPSLQKKEPAAPPKNVVTPRVKPSLALPQSTVASADPVPVPPINPAKLPGATEEEKFETVATPVVKMDTAPIPAPEKIEKVKEEIAQGAAEKLTGAAKAEPEEVVVEASKTPIAPVEAAPTTQTTQTQEDAEKEIQLAAITPDAGPPASKAAAEASENITRLLFPDGTAELPSTAQSSLQTIADDLKSEKRQNVQLLAYGSGNNVSAARRLSLGRALAVRSKLIDLGVDNRQIEVRALGEPEGGPSDRVDLLLITR